MTLLLLFSITALFAPINRTLGLSFHQNDSIRRRDFIATTSKLTLPLILQPCIPPNAWSLVDYEPDRPRTILITGSNSGIGLNAALRMAQQPCGHTLILACRTLRKAQDAISNIQASCAVQGTLLPMECDLANLYSIQFCAEWFETQSISIDVLCLNAAVARNTSAQDVLRTKQGFELTIGTNHLGHFYLTQQLMPRIRERIVVTASGVHDPESPGGAQGSKATLGTLQGMETQGIHFEMIDGARFDADKAYKDSKVRVYVSCFVMTV
jgi:protochlorophyllide reductase